MEELEHKNTQDDQGVTLLHVAALFGHLHIIKHLITEIKGDINPPVSKQNGKTPLHIAAQEGHLNVVSFYTEELAKEEFMNQNPGSIADDQFKRRTPLHSAAQEGHLPVVQHICNLLRVKNPKDSDDYTPLHAAATFGHLDVVKFLFRHAKEKHPKNGVHWGQNTPLDLAKKGGHSDVVNFLSHSYFWMICTAIYVVVLFFGIFKRGQLHEELRENIVTNIFESLIFNTFSFFFYSILILFALLISFALLFQIRKIVASPPPPVPTNFMLSTLSTKEAIKRISYLDSSSARF